MAGVGYTDDWKTPEHTDQRAQYGIKNDMMTYLLVSQPVEWHLQLNPTAAALILFWHGYSTYHTKSSRSSLTQVRFYLDRHNFLDSALRQQINNVNLTQRNLKSLHRITGFFLDFSIVRFRKLDLFPSSDEGGEDTYSVGPLRKS
jgi:hypothetical protein